MSDETGDADTDPMIGDSIIEQLFELWINPELERRGSGGSKWPEVRKALIVMTPGESTVDVRINEEADLFAHIRMLRSVEEGEEVRLADVGDVRNLRPVSVDEDSGWLAYATLPDGRRFASFDLRRNKGSATRFLDRADSYYSATMLCADNDLHGPAIDLLQAAYELSVKALKAIFHDVGGIRAKSHTANTRWIERWAQDGNVPDHHKRLANELVQLRMAARYSDAPIEDGPTRVQAMSRSVREFLDYVRSEVNYGNE